MSHSPCGVYKSVTKASLVKFRSLKDQFVILMWQVCLSNGNDVSTTEHVVENVKPGIHMT